MKNIKGKFSKNLVVALGAILLLALVATPALSTYFAPVGSVNTKAMVNGAVKTKKIANGAVTRAKINRTGLNADLLDGKDGAAYVAKTGDQAMAGNLTAGNVSYGSAKTGYITIAGTALQPSNSSVSYFKSFNTVQPQGTGAAWFVAPVNVPQGATVTELRVKAYDNDATYTVQTWMYRATSTGIHSSMATASTSGQSAVWQSVNDSSIVNPVIDNSTYGYEIWAVMQGAAGADNKISLVTVVYTYTTAGD